MEFSGSGNLEPVLVCFSDCLCLFMFCHSSVQEGGFRPELVVLDISGHPVLVYLDPSSKATVDDRNPASASIYYTTIVPMFLVYVGIQ